jgi:putative peptidoglycan lipid II flippase
MRQSLDLSTRPHREQSRSASAVFLSLGAVIIGLINLGISQLLAYHFGASRHLDAFFVAMVIPVTMVEILVVSLSNLLLPAFVKLRAEKSEKESWSELSAPINQLFLLLTIASVLGIIFAHDLIRLTAPGFDHELTGLASSLLMILFPSIIFASILSISIAVSYSYKTFVFPVLAKVSRWIVTLLAMWLLIPHFGIYGAAGAMLLGLIVASLSSLSVTPGKQHYQFSLKLVHSRQVLLLRSWGILLGANILHKLFPILERYFASNLGEGNVSYIAYAANFTPLFTTIISASIATVFFPDLARSIAVRDRVGLSRDIARSIRMSAFVMFPVILILVSLGEPTIRLLFERGKFGPADTQVVALLLLATLGVFLAPVVADTTSRVIYSLQKVSVILVTSVVSILLYIITAYLLTTSFGIYGIAVAGSLVYTLSATGQLIYLKWTMVELPIRDILRSLGVIAICAITVAFVARGLHTFLETTEITHNWPGQLLALLLAGTGAITVYGAMASLLRMSEIATLQLFLYSHWRNRSV